MANVAAADRVERPRPYAIWEEGQSCQPPTRQAMADPAEVLTSIMTLLSKRNKSLVAGTLFREAMYAIRDSLLWH